MIIGAHVTKKKKISTETDCMKGAMYRQLREIQRMVSLRTRHRTVRHLGASRCRRGQLFLAFLQATISSVRQTVPVPQVQAQSAHVRWTECHAAAWEACSTVGSRGSPRRRRTIQIQPHKPSDERPSGPSTWGQVDSPRIKRSVRALLKRALTTTLQIGGSAD